MLYGTLYTLRFLSNKFMFKKVFVTLFVGSFLFGGVCSAALLSETTWQGLGSDHADKFAEKAGFDQGANEKTLTQMVANIIAAFLGLLGVIFVILIVVAGYNWMTAGGDQEKVSKAGKRIYAAIIGLIIVAGAYAITYFVFRNLPSGEGGGTTIEATK